MTTHSEAFGFPICGKCKSAMMEITFVEKTMTQRCYCCKQPLSDRLYNAAHEEWLKRCSQPKKKAAIMQAAHHSSHGRDHNPIRFDHAPKTTTNT